MAKFKVGDKVRILDGSKIEDFTSSWTAGDNMSQYIGSIQTIRYVDDDWSDGRVSYLMEDIGFTWDERGLELVSNNQQKIIITTDGRVTKATMYEGKQRIKVATSTCHPNNEFDFNKGAAIALERLTGYTCGKIENAAINWHGFLNGEFSMIVTRKNISRFLKNCDEQNIAWKENRASKWNPFEKYDEAPEFMKMILKATLDFETTEKCYITVEDKHLSYSFAKPNKKAIAYD